MSQSCWQSVFRMRKVSLWLFQHPDHRHHCPGAEAGAASSPNGAISHRSFNLTQRCTARYETLHSSHCCYSSTAGSQSGMEVLRDILRPSLYFGWWIVLTKSGERRWWWGWWGWGWGLKFQGSKQLSRRASGGHEVPAALHHRGAEMQQRDWQVHQHNLMAF